MGMLDAHMLKPDCICFFMIFSCQYQFSFFLSLTPFNASVIMGPLWQTFVSSLQVYVRSSIEGIEDPYDGSYDSDGVEKSLDSFIIQV